jgi:hypothetical protein
LPSVVPTAEAPQSPAPAPPAPPPPPPAANAEPPGTLAEVVRDIALEDGATFRPAAALFRDFAIRCRQRGIASAHIDLARFRRMFAFAISGLDQLEDKTQTAIAHSADGVEDDVLAPYLAILIAATQGTPMPDEDELGRLYGSASPSRVRRLLDHLERQGRIVMREDFGGERSSSVPMIPAAA